MKGRALGFGGAIERPRYRPAHARRLLVEAAYHHRRGPVVGEALARRQRGHAPEITNISWKA
jgi:hypothetical protein